jgi:anti-sigma B factor antagonist
MIIKHNVLNGVDVVEVRGRLDMTHAAEARAALADIVDKGAGRLVVDCCGLDFVDSSGLSVLVTTLKLLDAKSGRLVIANLPGHLQSLLALTRLNAVFQVFAGTEAAVDYLRRTG